jgi:hypothetical protein
MGMNECRHEWADDQSSDERMFVCLKCGQRLEAGPLTALIIKSEQQLGMTIDPTSLAVIQGADMPLSWTTERPAVPGWFWFEDFTLKIGPVIVMWTGSEYSLAGTEGMFLPSDQSQWAGPLEPPT